MIIECAISTPQFIGGKKVRMHVQTGMFDTDTFLFTPHLEIDGNHKVQFKSKKQFNKYRL